MKDISKLKITALLAAVAVFALMGSFFQSYSPISTVFGAVLTPIQSKVVSLTATASSFFEKFYNYDTLKAENEQLKNDLLELQKLEREYNEAIAERDALRALARITAENPDYDMDLATVTAVDMGEYHKTLTIDKGESDGVELYDCVTVREGLVGYVSKVGPNFSEVTTVIDPAISIGARVSQSQEIVVAEGSSSLTYEKKLRLSYLDNDTESEVRDVGETSGYGDIYPKGIVIGYIDEIKDESHGLSKYAVITPAVDFSKLQKVYVIKDFED